MYRLYVYLYVYGFYVYSTVQYAGGDFRLIKKSKPEWRMIGRMRNPILKSQNPAVILFDSGICVTAAFALRPILPKEK